MNSAISKYDSTWTSTQQERLGAGQFDALGGRVFHYASADSTGADRGKLLVSETQDAQHVDLSFQTAPAVGDVQVKVTLGSNAVTADQYKDGWFVVQDATGEGRAYPIEGHAAADASATATFDLKEAIDTAGALAETNVDLIRNLYSSVQLSVADQADVPVGVAIVAATASYFGWVQTWGACAVWHDEADPIGDTLTIGGATAGQVEQADASDEPTIGLQGPTAAGVADYQLVYLKLDPIVGNSG